MHEDVTHSTPVRLSHDDLALLLEALDSHEYWQVGKELPRHDGMVWVPGDSLGVVDRHWEAVTPTTEEAEAIDRVRRCRELAQRLANSALAP